MNRRLSLRGALTFSIALVASLAGAPPAAAQAELELVANVRFTPAWLATVKVAEMRVCVRDEQGVCMRDENGNILYEDRDFAFTVRRGPNALLVVDVTDPAAPAVVGTGCLNGPDSFSFEEGSIDIRPDLGLLVAEGRCEGSSEDWITVFDISHPFAPKPLASLHVDRIHGITFHPTQPAVYISSNLDGSAPTAPIRIVDLSDPSDPRLAGPFTSLAPGPHAISFNRTGTRAYAASRTHTKILDTTNALSPILVASIYDPSNALHEWAKVSPSGRYLAVGDGDSGLPCPGGVHFYDLGVEALPLKVGTFVVPESTATNNCSNGYFAYDQASGLLAVPWAGQGTFLLDPSSPVGLGATVVARTDTASTWNAHSSTFYKGRIFGIDAARGLDIFDIPSDSTGAKIREG